MAFTTFHRPRRPTTTTTSTSSTTTTTTTFSFRPRFSTTTLLLLLLLLIAVSVAGVFLLRSPFLSSSCSPFTTITSRTYKSPNSHTTTSFRGNLLNVDFAWNGLHFSDSVPPPAALKIAVFIRKWPVASAPGGMERHALTLHSALSARGHRVHVFTSAPPSHSDNSSSTARGALHLHFLRGPPGQWRCDDAWALYESLGPFDAVHSESVAVFHRRARVVPHLAATWHGVALENLHSEILQDLARAPGEPASEPFNLSTARYVYKVLDEVRFFHSYAHHVAISNAAGEMLRDVYQIPRGRVHVILNGVEADRFGPDPEAGRAFRSEIGLPDDAALVMGVSGRLVKDKGHPILFRAFSKLTLRHPNAYLVVAGSGPWAKRYAKLGPNVQVLGPLPPTRIGAFYNSLDVFVDPTLRPQGLDLTLMEAMMCGKPVAATRLPSIKGSVVVDEEFGLMFAPNAEALGDALELAVSEGAARLAERGRACREYAASMFTAKKMALAYERLFLCIKNETYCDYP